MKLLKFVLLLLIIVAGSAVTGWSAGSNSVTDFYYYKGKPYFLNIRHNKIFVRTKEVMTEESFRQLLGQNFQLSKQSHFDVNLKEQFIDLVSPLDESALNVFVSSMALDSRIDLVSAVYSPVDNDKVLQGSLDQLIAQFKPYVTNADIMAYLNSHGLSIVKQLAISGGNTYILQVAKSVTMTNIETANSVYESGLVNFCDPDFYYSGMLTYIPNDTFYPMQWSMHNTGTNIPGTGTGTAGCDMKVDSAWNNTLGNVHCLVSMVDSGIDTTHPDIIGNMTHGYNYDFINGHPGCYDDFNHGTCTAGIVAATGNNNLGVSGVCPQAKLLGVKIFNSGGSTSTTALTQGLMYSWQQGGWISSNSWGGGSPVTAADQTIQDGTTTGRGGKGTVFCVAAGNGNGPVQWPATNPYVICVGGCSPCNQRKSPTSCDLENFWGASYGTGTSVVAPCVKIYATDRQGANGYSSTDYFDQFNGTSSATPNCAGVCALGMSRDSTAKWDTVRARICWTADKVGSYAYTSAGPYSMLGSTWNNEMGYGKVNANRFVNAFGAPPPPLGHNVAVGPFMNFPAGPYLINTAYTIKTQIANIGANNETNVPFAFYVDGALINTTNKNLNVNQVDSVSNSWQTAVAGNHTLKYISQLSTDLDRSNDTIQITINVVSALPALCEQFASATFPPTGWSISGSYWGYNTVSGFGVGTGSARFNSWSAPAGTDQNLVSLTYNPLSNQNIHFDVAYSPYPATPPYSQDSLVVLGSTNGGSTYFSISRLGPVDMQSAPASSSEFTPTSTQWRKFNYSVPSGTNKIQFLGRSQFGDDIFVDSICVDGVTGISSNGNTVPSVYTLSQNFPNPFNPTTVINFGLPKSGLVKLVVYDILGRTVVTLVNNEFKEAGSYKVDFNAANLASGVYFYRIDAGDFTSVKKMLLIK